MNRSEQINELATALSKAQGTMRASGKSGTNPFFKHAYATFDDILAAIKKPLADNGLAFTQLLDRDGETQILTTMLIHTSGQYIAASAELNVVPSKGTNALQDFGKAITYMKRYALAAMLGVSSDEDTDAQAREVETPKTAQPPNDIDLDSIEPIDPDDTAPMTSAPHWIDDDKTRSSFWAWCGKRGIDDVAVHETLKVKHLDEYAGTVGDAKTALAKL